MYLQNTGWVTVAIELAAGQWDHIDITFAAGGAGSRLVGDGTANRPVHLLNYKRGDGLMAKKNWAAWK